MKYVSLIIFLFVPTFFTQSGNKNNTEQKPESSIPLQMCLEGITEKNSKKVRMGLRNGANVNYIDKNGQSLFYWACETRKPSIIAPFIVHKNLRLTERDSQGNTPLHLACYLGLHSTVNSMLITNPELATMPNKWGCTPLHGASFHGHKKCIRTLLFHNNSIINWQNNNLETALHNASKINVIEQLIKQGANPTIQNTLQKTSLMNLFIKNSDNKGKLYSPLFTHSNVIVKQIIQATDKDENTQLHLCCAAQNINRIKFKHYLSFLTRHGVNPDARNNKGKKAVDLACQAYNTIYNYYLTNSSPNIYPFLINQEHVMHAVLRLTCARTQCALFTNLLRQPSSDNMLLPTDLIRYIIYIYYALQIETVIANKYQSREVYYYEYIEDKNEIKNQLLAKPELKLLWST